MLCLGRRQGQEIEISGPCRITVLRAIGNVRLGIEANRDVQIVRSELVCAPLPADAADFELDEDEEVETGGEA